MRPPSFICSNASLRREERAAGGRCRSCGEFLDACLLDFWDRCSNVVDEHVNIPKSACLVDGALDTVGPRVRQ
jgi:hypothetical protein